MHDMTQRRRPHQQRRARFGVVAGVALLATGCAAAGGSGDKGGGPGEPVVLTLATVNGDLGFTPEVTSFVDAVAEASDGALQIEVRYEIGDFAPDSEKQVVQSVAAGRYDLGVVGTQVFDTLGIGSFRALNAPMLVDSYALQAAVIHSGVTDQMMQPLTRAGVKGLAVLAGVLRRPVAVDAPLGGPGDWSGITFSTFDSELQFEAVRALGAKPVAVVGDARDQALREGSLDGFESSVLAYAMNGQQETAPYLTTNVTLWPQMLAVVTGPDLDGRLTDEERDWLSEAVEQAVSGTPALAEADARALEDVCAAGARLWDAPEADLAALEDAFAGVYADLRRDHETAALLDQIETVKESTPAEPAISAPEGCGGVPAPGDEEGPGTAPANLNGVYRYTLTHEDAVAVGQGDDPEYPMTQTWWLDSGHWRASGGSSGEYRVDGDQISFQWIEPFEGVYTFTVSRDDDGNLTLVPAEPMDPGDAFLMTGKPWTKIG